jgi:hypothetical protein
MHNSRVNVSVRGLLCIVVCLGSTLVLHLIDRVHRLLPTLRHVEQKGTSKGGELPRLTYH